MAIDNIIISCIKSNAINLQRKSTDICDRSASIKIHSNHFILESIADITSKIGIGNINFC